MSDRQGATESEASDLVKAIQDAHKREYKLLKENLELISELSIARKTIKALLKLIDLG